MSDVRVVPANEASWDDLRAVFGARGVAYRCQCQWLKVDPAQSRSLTTDERAQRLRGQAGCDGARDDERPGGLPRRRARGLVCRRAEVGLPAAAHLRSLWKGHAEEDLAADDTWAVTCFVVRVGFRRRGVTRALTAAAVEHARRGGARVVEGYPMDTVPGERVSGGDLFVGSRSVFEAAGFTEAWRVSPRRSVVRRVL